VNGNRTFETGDRRTFIQSIGKNWAKGKKRKPDADGRIVTLFEANIEEMCEGGHRRPPGAARTRGQNQNESEAQTCHLLRKKEEQIFFEKKECCRRL